LILKIKKNPEPDIITKSKNYPILKLNTTLSSLITSELQPLTSSVFLLANFSKNSTWKMWFRPVQRIFHGKNGPNSLNFKKKKIQIARFLQ
jgi:hypothetical protein